MWCPIQIPCPIFAAVILQCEKPLHHWSYALMPSFAKNRLTMKFWGLYLQYLQKLSWNFHLSLSGCSDIAGNQQYITGLSIYYRDVTCSDGLNLKKSTSDCSVLASGTKYWPFIWAKRSTARRVLMVHISTSCAYVLSLWRARSQHPHASQDNARAATGPDSPRTFWRWASQ